ncbi:MAG: hypothetical protein JXD23_09475 [Spirochaetales bacterium]|nr:hypothetical protein [Spirochaetales bacterium]
MPEITAKLFNRKIQTINKIIDGIKEHQADEGFPAMLNLKAVEKIRDVYAASRKKVDDAAAQYRQDSQQFKLDDRTFDKTVSQLKSLIYGLFGKKNAAVRDFGLLPFKDSKPKKLKTQA